MEAAVFKARRLTDAVTPKVGFRFLINTRAEQSFVVERHSRKEVEATFGEIVVLEGGIRTQGL
jgi:hypothetical protein